VNKSESSRLRKRERAEGEGKNLLSVQAEVRFPMVLTPPESIVTTRLILRKPRLSDADYIFDNYAGRDFAALHHSPECFA